MAATPGDRFQADVRRAIHDRMGLSCFQLNKNVLLSSLHPGTPPDEHLEIDLLAIVGKYGVLIETTRQSSGNSKKVKGFIRHCDLFLSSATTMRDRIQLLGDFSEEDLDNIENITDWRYLYVGTSPELITKRITPRRYPDTDKLHILNGENWQYLNTLSRRIGRFSQFELLAAVNIGPEDTDDVCLGEDDLNKPTMETTNRRVAPHTGLADLYLLVFKPEELLRVGRVLRYKGQPIAIESEDSGGGYQRLLIPTKLRAIAKFIGDDPRAAFPSTLTVVLSSDCKLESADGSSRVVIPKRYASIDIIDGQHRLFAYAQDGISDSVRASARLLVTAIKFHAKDPKVVNQYAAKTFVSINSNHTKVKRALIDLISYEVLGDTSPRAIAAKILLDCTDRPGKALSQVFQTSEFAMSGVGEPPPIPIVSVVDELTSCFDVSRYENEGLAVQVKRAFGCEISDLHDPKTRIKKGVEILEKYFSTVQHQFPKDWRNKDSRLMCAKYLGGFVRLLRSFIRFGLNMDEINDNLSRIKLQVVNEVYPEGQDPNTVLVFDNSSETLPSKRDTSAGQMHDKLLAWSLFSGS